MARSTQVGVSKETRDERTQRKLDLELDRELEDTFPASDALKIIHRKSERSPAVEQTPED